MEDFLNDPYEDTKRRINTNNTRYNSDNGQYSDLADLQFTVAPTNSGSQDMRSNYAMPTDPYYNAQNPAVEKDPFLETFDFLGSPTQQAVSPNFVPGNDPWTDNLGDSLYGDRLSLNTDPLNNLDLLVLPENSNSNIKNMLQNGNNANLNMFQSSQYFSPNSRGANFGQLNSIVEDSVSPSYYNNAFSPIQSRHGSVSIPPPLNLYLLQHLLSPQTNTLDGSFDTLKLPYSGSYLNSPPSMHELDALIHADAKQRPPAPQSELWDGSFRNGCSNKHTYAEELRPAWNPKQLTLEEKAKRRREFHNAVERRRRDLIKEKIKVLGFLVPPLLLTPQVCAVQAILKQPSLNTKEMKELLASIRVKEAKPNKAFILQTSVDYIRHLQYVLEQQSARKQELEDAISKLRSSPSPLAVKEELVDPVVKPETSLLPSEFDPDEFFSADI
ncbi:hypothetical protein HF325_004868 [Metschnikowia pulcherrima]|uniref:BHLH domain-containing protein n=1 Tax=Metschnikowia pulcherrima TaxID=27326 RepID=A0A8H7LAD9_9ASCO|nr:hypothetical protein HF325_004868 [Metschnikowia pulcherrima]